MKCLKPVVRLLVLAAFVAAFAGWRLPFTRYALKVQGLLWGLLATLCFGRLFCEVVCPLGILQSLVNFVFHPRRHVRRVCTRLPEMRRQRVVRWSVFAACVILAAAGAMGVAELFVPLAVVGRAAVGWWPGVVMLALVLVLAAFRDGRCWCNWVCPFGTLYNLVAKASFLKSRVGSGCGNCRRCMKAALAEKAAAEPSDGVTRRDALKGVALVAVTEKLTDGGLAAVSLPGVPEREREVLPPGAGDARTFALKCAGCQLCVSACPGECLAPSFRFRNFGQPAMDFRRGHCLPTCVKCTEVCPEGALERLTAEARRHVHMGYAVWRRERCVRTVNGEPCQACVRKCPVKAVRLVHDFVVVDRDACIGCGACEHVCPARPEPAIAVEGLSVQRFVRPLGEEDLLLEMRSRLAKGAAVVTARRGVIVAEEYGRGVAPLLKLLDEGRLGGMLVMDKVVGRAAAAICVVGGAKKVVTHLAGEGAAKVCAAAGVELSAEVTVPSILNRDRSGSCPMEEAVDGIDEPAAMVAAVREKLELMKKECR